MEPIVQLKNLSKTINSKPIIKDLSLDFYPGQITGFLGPNGAGKTTTIRMMTGLMHPTSGEVLIEGISLAADYERAIANVGVIVENPEMYKFMSGYKNLVHFARMHKGIPKSRIDEVVAQVGLQKRIHEKVSTYSLGMRQRLGLAQALLHRPKFLILDEPTNGLDPAGIREFRQHLRHLAVTENLAVVVSSHLLSEIELMCDRVAIIQNGALIDIQNVQKDDTSSYYIEATPTDVLQKLLQNHEPVPHNDGFLIHIARAEVPKLIKQISEHVDIFTVQPAHKTLEDQFLEMTGGGAIDEVH